MKQTGLIKALCLTHKYDLMPEQERHSIQQQRLHELVTYAKSNSPYFSNLYSCLNDNFSLSDIPITNKTELMTHFDEWMTDREITMDKVSSFMSDVSNIGKKLENKYLVYTTSGSTGKPCVVLYDDTTINVASAIGVLRSFARKQDLKAFIKNGGKTIALFADNGFYLGCGSVKFSVRKMPWKKRKMKTCDVRKPVSEIVSFLNDFQPTMIGCYPTALEIISKEQEIGNLHIHPTIIMTGGEKLTEDVRKHLSHVFDCYVQTNYSCTEGGTIACECTEQHFHINDDWVILEAVDKNNQPVPFGTQSAKVLLTNLANRVCPIIRFEITDRVVMHNEPCKCGNIKPWLTLEGRTDDVLTFDNGIQIAPLSLYAVMKEIHEIKRFQLIQVSQNHLELRLIATDKQLAFAKAKDSVESYLRQNGISAEITLSEKLPEVHPDSGKFRHIIAEKKL